MDSRYGRAGTLLGAIAVASSVLWGGLAAGQAAGANVARDSVELTRELPVMLPRVMEWAERQAAHVIERGSALSPQLQELARRSGVRDPSRIRVLVVDRIALPEEPALKVAASSVGLAPASAAGMTLGYAVTVHRGYQDDPRLMSHEFRHVAQYEQAGGIRAFLAIHLPQLLEFGYEDSPFEVDARAHEAHAH
jgi:hypothetical protein